MHARREPGGNTSPRGMPQHRRLSTSPGRAQHRLPSGAWCAVTAERIPAGEAAALRAHRARGGEGGSGNAGPGAEPAHPPHGEAAAFGGDDDPKAARAARRPGSRFRAADRTTWRNNPVHRHPRKRRKFRLLAAKPARSRRPFKSSFWPGLSSGHSWRRIPPSRRSPGYGSSPRGEERRPVGTEARSRLGTKSSIPTHMTPTRRPYMTQFFHAGREILDVLQRQ